MRQMKKAIAILLTLLLALTDSSFAALSEEAVNDEVIAAATQEPTPLPYDESGEAAVPSPDTETVDVPVTEPDAPSDAPSGTPSDAPSAPPAYGEESETEDVPADESADQESEPDAGTAEPADPLPEEEGGPVDPPANAPAETLPSEPEDEDLEDIYFTVEGDLEGFDIDEIKRIILASKGCKHARLQVYNNDDWGNAVYKKINSEEHEVTYWIISRKLECLDCWETIKTIEVNKMVTERYPHAWLQEGKRGHSNKFYCMDCNAKKTVDYPCTHKQLLVQEDGNAYCPICHKKAALHPENNCKHQNFTVWEKGDKSTTYEELDSTVHLKSECVYYYDDSFFNPLYCDAICDDCGIWLSVKKVGNQWKVDSVGITSFMGWPETVSSTIEPHNFAAGICVECGEKEGSSTEGPTSVTITNPLETLGMGESYTLTAKLDQNEELAGYNSWKSSNTKVLKVNSSGKMTGVKAGTATVTVTTLNNRSARLTVKVQAAPSKLTLGPKKGTLGVGQKVTLTATLPKNTASQITWASSDAKVATVENGVVTAVAAGANGKAATAKITATTFNKKSAAYTVTVRPVPTAVRMEETLALCVSQRYSLSVALEPAAAACGMTFTSDNEDVATVDADGKVTALTPGHATLRLETHNGLSASCEVNVYPAPTQVRIAETIKKLGVKESVQLHAQIDSDPALLAHCSWKSSNSKIIKVDATGKVTALKAGTAKITAKMPNGTKASLNISVVKAPGKVTLSQSTADLKPGDTLRLTATLPKNTASQITWTSSDANVATVEDGLVTANTSGEAIITAETYNGKCASCVITIKP